MLGKIEGRGKKGWQKIRWSHSITKSVDLNLSKLLWIMDNSRAYPAIVHEVIKSWT